MAETVFEGTGVGPGLAPDLLASLQETARNLSLHVGNAAQALDSAAIMLAAVERTLVSPCKPERATGSELPHGLRPPDFAPDEVTANRRIDSFHWESDADGTICWVEGAPRAQVVGRHIDREGGRAPADHRAFRNMSLHLSGVDLEGEWRLSGVPCFDPASGRFIGYRGGARRLPPSGSHDEHALTALPHDMVRQLVHEIRTPLNAILGFAGMIDGEHLGPANPSYRARAADIVRRAGEMLEAVESLDARARGEPACQTLRASAIATRPGEGL